MKDEVIQVRISHDTKQKLKALCQIEDISQSEWIRTQILIEYYKLERRMKEE